MNDGPDAGGQQHERDDADDLMPASRRSKVVPAVDLASDETTEDAGSRLVQGVVEALLTVRRLSPVAYAGSAADLLWELWSFLWLAVVLPICVLTADSSGGAVCVFLVLYRVAEIVVDRSLDVLEPDVTRDPRRTLLLAAVHLAEVVLVVAVIRVWQTGARAGVEIITGFDVVTFRGPSLEPGNWLDAATVIGTVASMLLLATAVMALVRLGRSES